MRKDTSDLKFNQDTVNIFFSDYEHMYNDEFMYTVFADKVFLIDTYSYLWIFRELMQNFSNNKLNPENFIDSDVNGLVVYALKLYPSLKDRKIELYYNFRDFVEMGQENLAIYAMNLLEGV